MPPQSQRLATTAASNVTQHKRHLRFGYLIAVWPAWRGLVMDEERLFDGLFVWLAGGPEKTMAQIEKEESK